MTDSLVRPSRRSVVRAAAWSVPVVSIAAAAPAFAASLSRTATLTSNGSPDKWGTGGDPKNVAWDLTLTNGAVPITSISIVFTYLRANNTAYAGTSFTIFDYSSDGTSWTVLPNPIPNPAGTGVITASASGITALNVVSIHTLFSGQDNSMGRVRAVATINYSDSTSSMQTIPFTDFVQKVHVSH